MTTNAIHLKTIQIEAAPPIVRVVAAQDIENRHVMKGHDDEISYHHVQPGIAYSNYTGGRR